MEDTKKNTVFTITPPDIRLSTNGPSVFLIGMKLDETTPYIKVIDNFFPDVEISYYACNDAITDETLTWFRAVAGIASSIIINIDNITPAELLLGMEAENQAHMSVYWVTTGKNPILQKLLNSYSYRIYSNITDFEEYISNRT